MSIPTIMVSSTCYDLKQLRNGLKTFIEEKLEYEALLSEYNSFPIDPDINAVSNCRQRVENNADILVLIIGSRYGYIDQESNKSITNLEYLEARKKNIPIYVYIDKKVLTYLDLWKDNKEIDLSKYVDSNKIFEFIEKIRSEDKVWTVGFDLLDEITTSLKIQLSNLFYSSLQTKRKMNSLTHYNYFSKLEAESLKILLEKPVGWEYLLYFQVWIDGIEELTELFFDYDNDIFVGDFQTVAREDYYKWSSTRFQELRGYINALNILIDEKATEAFGEYGVAGDEYKIVKVAKKITSVTKSLLRWSLKTKSTYVEEPFESALKELSKFPDDAIKKIREFGKHSFKQLKEALHDLENKEPQKLILTLKVEITENNYDVELEKATDLMKTNPDYF